MTEYHTLSNAYFSGTISRVDERCLRAWLCEDKQHLALWRQWEQEWVAQNAYCATTSAAWLRLQDKFSSSHSTIIPMPVWRRPIFRWTSVACCVIILIVFAIHNSHRPTISMPVQLAMADSIQHITLSDGSFVVLNQGSELCYEYTSEGVRTIYLTGEAYFEVAPDKAHPFVVYADGVQVRVTGTHFNVSAYPEDAQCRTSLLEGSVTVSNALFTSDLVPGEQLIYTSATGAIMKDHCDAQSAVAWMEGRYDYNHIQMGELMGRLARTYGRDIVLTNEDAKLLDVHFVMNDTLPLSDVIQALALTYHLSVETTPNGYRIN